MPEPILPPIAGDSTALTAQQTVLVGLAARLGRERFAPRAARWDREASFPIDNFKDLREAGLLAICVPEAHGGLGADFATYALVAAEIGRHCRSTALSFSMHVCSTMWSGFIADAMDMSPLQRADHEHVRAIPFRPRDRTGPGLLATGLRGRCRSGGQGALERGLLLKEAMERSLQTLAQYLKRCQEWEVQKIFAAGTSALREAKNSEDLLKLAEEKLDLSIEVISGEEEAQVSFLAVAEDLQEREKSILVVDVGGGSTELFSEKATRSNNG